MLVSTNTNAKAFLEMVANANANATFKEIPVEIVAECDKVNEELSKNTKDYFATLSKEEFINKFFNVSIPKNLKENEIEKHIKNSVSSEQISLYVNDNSLIEYKITNKPISFKEIFVAKLNLLAKAHADEKITKADKQKANEIYFGSYGIGYCDLLTHSARLFTNIDEKAPTTNASYKKTFEKVNEICGENATNPFTKSTNSGYSEQISLVANYFIGENATKLNAYYCKGLFQMICNRGKFGKYTIADTNTVLNAFAIVYRYAFNGYKMPTKEKSKIYKISEN